MTKILAMHELIPAMLTIVRVTDSESVIQRANQQIIAMLSFLEKHLTGNSYIAGDWAPPTLRDRITYAEIVAGSLILWLPYLNITLSNYPQVEIWSNRLMQRPAWQATQQSPEVIQNWLKRIQKLSKLPERQWQQRR